MNGTVLSILTRWYGGMSSVRVNTTKIPTQSVNNYLQTSLDEATDSWGVKVERVEV